ncbi:hypothetical protein P7C73_g1676, partial [Tremellales sp. Uapishka_1]
MLALPTLFTLLASLSLISASNHGSSLHRKRHAHGKKSFKAIPERDEAPQWNNETTVDLAKRDSFTGRGTFFYVGLGACGQNSVDSDLMVALNTAQYGSGYPGPECFKYITITANGVTVSGVEIMDECPTCDYGGLDMSPGLFQRFADESVGVLSITWYYEGDSTTSSSTPTSTWVAPTTSSSVWVAPSTSTTPTSTWVAPTTSSSVWVAPTTSTSTWVAPTTSSTWVAASSSTSTWVAPSSSTSSSTSTPSSSSTTALLSSSSSSSSSTSSLSSSSPHSASKNATSDPYAEVQTVKSTATISSSPSAASGGVSETVEVDGNLILLNALTAQYGQIVVYAAGGYDQ